MSKKYCQIWLVLVAACFFFSCQNEENDNRMEEVVLENEIFLWEDAAPGSEAITESQTVIERESFNCPRNRAIEAVSKPSITPFFPSNPNGVSIIICPGGGYQKLAFDKEGTHLAQWFNRMGITAFVLKYRLPGLPHKDSKNVPLQDAQRAIRLVKSKAIGWNLDPDKVGIMGSSAGGHLAASLGVGFEKWVYSPRDSIDEISARPTFMVLLYPVITMDSSLTHMGSRNLLLGKDADESLVFEFSPEKQVKVNTPTTFLAHAQDDGAVSIENSILFDEALKSAKINSALHIYPNGGHGGAICEAEGTDFANWIYDCHHWLAGMGLVNE